MSNDKFTGPKAERAIRHILLLIQQKAMTANEIADAVCIVYRRACEYISHMRRDPEISQQMHIESWEEAVKQGTPRARYRYGYGVDAPMPPKKPAERKPKPKVERTEEEREAMIDARLRKAALKETAKYPIQRHWMDVALFGPAKGAQA